MADISKITIGSNTHNIKDAVAREGIARIEESLKALKLPLVVEKSGVKYTLDIADDADGIDLVINKE